MEAPLPARPDVPPVVVAHRRLRLVVEPAVWLGYVSRADYVQALDADARPHDEPQDATVTPGCHRGWLSGAVRWTKLSDLSLAWWHKHVESAV